MERERKQLYEVIFIINAQLSEEAREKALARIKQNIEDQGGVIHKVHDWGRRKLCYYIRKRRDGNYFIIYFTLNTQRIVDLQREFLLNEDLMRFMFTTAEAVQETIQFKPLAQV